MAQVITETTDGVVTVTPVRGHHANFVEVAQSLTAAGEVSTVTTPTGIGLQASVATAKKAGVVKATRNRKKEDNG